MQEREKVYTEFEYGDARKSCEAARIVWAEAHTKAVVIHFMNHNNVMDSIRVNHNSLLQIVGRHKGSFVMINRHTIVRRRFMLGIQPNHEKEGTYTLSARFVEHPLEISRRRLPIVEAALDSKKA